MYDTLVVTKPIYGHFTEKPNHVTINQASTVHRYKKICSSIDAHFCLPMHRQPTPYPLTFSKNLFETHCAVAACMRYPFSKSIDLIEASSYSK